MPDDPVTMDMIRYALQGVKTAEQELREAKERYYATLRSHNLIEEVAKRLWVMKVEREDDSAELIQEWSENVGRRDEQWISLLLESERDEFRDLAYTIVSVSEALNP